MTLGRCGSSWALIWGAYEGKRVNMATNVDDKIKKLRPLQRKNVEAQRR